MVISLRYFLLTGVVILLLTGCKKSDSPAPAPSSYMRFKLNGVQVTCDNNFYATPKSTTTADANISFNARWGNKSLDMKLFTYLTNDIAPGSYTFATLKQYGAEIYPDGSPGPVYVAGSPNAPAAVITGSGQITITEINAQYLKGTFDFVTGANINTGLTMTVTNGEFYMRR